MKSALVRVFGFPATLVHGDTLVLDRWVWLRKRLPPAPTGPRLLDVGCGTGAFTIGASLRGYEAIGLSWDERNQGVASVRAALCKAPARFEIQDIRRLDERPDLHSKFDVVTCLEAIEHILDDTKLMADIALCLKPGGRLLLTTPNYHYKAITPSDNGPFSTVEDGWHVRKGYTAEDLASLCERSGLVLDQSSFCSGLLSQKITYVLRVFSKLHPLLGWVVVLPLRLMPLFFDPLVERITRWPQYSLCIEAHKPVSQPLAG